MKSKSLFLAILGAFAPALLTAQPTPTQVREATAAETAAGTAHNVYISPARLSGSSSVLPSQTGNSGKFLTTDGSSASWGTSEQLKTAAGLPTSSTDNGIPRFDSTAGNFQTSSVLISDVASNNVFLSGIDASTDLTLRGGLAGATIALGRSATGGVAITAAGTDQNITLMPSGTGNVGIKTINPLQALHIVTESRGFNSSFFGFASGIAYPIVIEAQDATLALLSENEGGHGSGINMMEADAGNLSWSWMLFAGTSSGVYSGDLVLKGGTNKDYTANTVTMRIARNTGGNFFLDQDNVVINGNLVALGAGALQSWASGFSAVQIGGSFGIMTQTAAADANDTHLVHNAYYNGTNWIRISADEAASYRIGENGTHLFRVAPSGSAGSTVTWTDAVQIDNNGNLITAATTRVSTDTLSGAGAVSITKDTTKLTSSGVAQAITLADGADGQIKRIIHEVDGGSMVLTPTTKTGWSTATFSAAGDSLTLEFVTTRGWIVLGSYGTVIAP